MKLFSAFVATALTVAVASPAFGHAGRRLDIQVLNGQIFAQGYISDSEPDDGGGVVRPYLNVIHNHFHNLGTSAFADLPGFDVTSAGPLAGFEINAELLSVSKWVNPPVEPLPGTIPTLEPLGSEFLEISHNSSTINSSTLGSLSLVSSVPPSGISDLDMLYTIDTNPTAVIYVMEWQLSTNASGIADSESVYILLSPDGANAMEKLHHASLYLESYLGIEPVPEPASIAMLGTGLCGLALVAYRRRRLSRS